MSERRQVLLRIDPAVHDALMRWANDELRSVNAQIEMLLRRALTDAGRMPKQAAPAAQAGPAAGGDAVGGGTPSVATTGAPLPADSGRPGRLAAPRPDRPSTGLLRLTTRQPRVLRCARAPRFRQG